MDVVVFVDVSRRTIEATSADYFFYERCSCNLLKLLVFLEGLFGAPSGERQVACQGAVEGRTECPLGADGQEEEVVYG